jgi:hypothetical protein
MQALTWPMQFGIPLGSFVPGSVLIVGESILDGQGNDGSEMFLPGVPVAFIYCALLAVVHFATVQQVFPFALGLGITRRTFFLATTLTVVVQSTVVGAVAVLLAQVERATGGWGTGMLLFGDGERSAVELFAAYTTIFLVFAAIGVVSGAIFVLGAPPALLVLLPAILALPAAALLAGFPTPVLGIAGAVVLAAVLGLTGYAVLRHAVQ